MRFGSPLHPSTDTFAIDVFGEPELETACALQVELGSDSSVEAACNKPALEEATDILDRLLDDEDATSPTMRPVETGRDFWCDPQSVRREGRYSPVPSSPFGLSRLDERRPDQTFVWMADMLWENNPQVLFTGSPVLTQAFDFDRIFTDESLSNMRDHVCRAVSFQDDSERYLGKQHDVAVEVLRVVYDGIAVFDTSHLGVSKLALWCVYNGLCSTLLSNISFNKDTLATQLGDYVFKKCNHVNCGSLGVIRGSSCGIDPRFPRTNFYRQLLPLREVQTTAAADWQHSLSTEAYTHLRRLSPWLHQLRTPDGPKICHHASIYFCGVFVKATQDDWSSGTNQQDYLGVAQKLCDIDK